MRLLRPLTLVLALLVSPLGAAVCEVVCGSPVHAAAHGPDQAAPPATEDGHHAHHAHHGLPAPAPVPSVQAGNVDARLAEPAEDCPPLSTAPARIRASFDPHFDGALAAAAGVAVLTDTTVTYLDLPSAPTSPPVPPLHAPVPLRI